MSFLTPYDVLRSEMKPLGARMEAAIVAAVNTTSGTVTVSIGGGTNIAGVPVAGATMPAVNDKVWILRQGTTALCMVGKVTTATVPGALTVTGALTAGSVTSGAITATGNISAPNLTLDNGAVSSRLVIRSDEDIASLADTSVPIRIDSTTSGTPRVMAIDANEIQVEDNVGVAQTLFLNPFGGAVEVGDATSFLKLVGARVDFGNNDYIAYDDTNNNWSFVSDGATGFRISSGGVVTVSSPWAWDAYRASDQTITNAAWNTLVCGSERYDSGIHASGVATIPSGGTGLWMFGAMCRLNGTTFTRARVGVIVDGTGDSYESSAGASGETDPYCSVMAVRYMTPGQTLTARAYQESGGSRTALGGTVRFWGARIA